MPQQPGKPVKLAVTPEDLFGSSVRGVDYASLARSKAKQYGLDEDLFERQMRHESVNYDPDVVTGRRKSPAGAMGIAQFMPETGARYGLRGNDFFDPDKALDAGARHMRDLLDENGGDYEAALAGYNAGQGRVNDGSWRRIKETRGYVRKIRGYVSDEIQLAVKPEDLFGGQGTASAAPSAQPSAQQPAPVAAKPKRRLAVPQSQFTYDPELETRFNRAKDAGNVDEANRLAAQLKAKGYEAGPGEGGWPYFKRPEGFKLTEEQAAQAFGRSLLPGAAPNVGAQTGTGAVARQRRRLSEDISTGFEAEVQRTARGELSPISRADFERKRQELAKKGATRVQGLGQSSMMVDAQVSDEAVVKAIREERGETELVARLEEEHLARLRALSPEEKARVADELANKGRLSSREREALGIEEGGIRQHAADILGSFGRAFTDPLGYLGALTEQLPEGLNPLDIVGLPSTIIADVTGTERPQRFSTALKEEMGAGSQYAQRQINKYGGEGLVSDVEKAVAGSLPMVAGGIISKTPGVVATIAGLQQAGQMREEAIAKGVDPDTATQMAQWGIPIGMIEEAFGIGRMSRAVPKGYAAHGLVESILRGFGEELAENKAQRILTDMAAKGTYDPERGIFIGLDYEDLVAGLAGGVFGAGFKGIEAVGERKAIANERQAAERDFYGREALLRSLPQSRLDAIERSITPQQTRTLAETPLSESPAPESTAREVVEHVAGVVAPAISATEAPATIAGQPSSPSETISATKPGEEAVSTAAPTPSLATKPETRPEEIASASPASQPGAEGMAEAEARTSDQKHDYSSTQVDLPSDVASSVKNLGSRIPDSDLAADGRENNPHITVKYGLHGDDAASVRKLLADEGPIKVKLGKTSLFENDDADVVKIDVDSPDLHRLNKKIADAIPHTDTFPDYKPHVTIAYVKPGEGKKYAGNASLEGKTITLDSIAFSDRAGNVTEIPLEGKPAASNETAKTYTQETPAAKTEAEPAPRHVSEQAVKEQTKPRLGDDAESVHREWRKLSDVHSPGTAVQLSVPSVGVFEYRDGKIVATDDVRRARRSGAIRPATNTELQQIDEAIEKGWAQIERREVSRYGTRGQQGQMETTVLHQATGRPLSEQAAEKSGSAAEKKRREIAERIKKRKHVEPMASIGEDEDAEKSAARKPEGDVDEVERRRQIVERIRSRKNQPTIQEESGEYRAARQTETPEFKRWFGESKVVDEDGKPLVVYHGTDAPDVNFPASSAGRASGNVYAGKGNFFFTPDPDVASGYAMQREWDIRGNPNVVPVYLSLQNPLIVDAEGKGYGSITADAIKRARRAGNDGVIIRNVIDAASTESAHPTTTYIAFSNKQIKSAIGNRGTFDPSDASIIREQGGSYTTTDADRVRDKFEQLKAQAARSGQPVSAAVEDFLSQRNLFGEEFSPEQAELLRQMARGQKRAAKPRDERQGSLFEGDLDEKTSAEIDSVIESRYDDTEQTAAGLARAALQDLARAGQAAISERSGGQDVRRRGRNPANRPALVALGITAPIATQGRIDLRGQIVRNAQDVAQLAQIFRDPRFETLRIVYVKGNEVITHEGVTSRLPDETAPFLDRKRRGNRARAIYQMKDRMRRMGADGFYLIHNHPSGEPVASDADLKTTAIYEAEVEGFKGHIIINSGKYGHIAPESPQELAKIRSEAEAEKQPTDPPTFVRDLVALELGDRKKGTIHVVASGKEEMLVASKPHPHLGAMINSTESAAVYGWQVQAPEGHVALLFTTPQGKLRAIENVPENLFLNPREFRKWLRGRKRDYGSARVISYSETIKPDDSYIKSGVLWDHVSLAGGSPFAKQTEIRRRPVVRVAEEGESDKLTPMNRPEKPGEVEQKGLPGKEAQPEAEEFMRWFGNGQVVNSDGSPRLLYTGQPAGLAELPPSTRSELPGTYHVFLTDRRDVAARYAGSHPTERSGQHSYSLGRKGKTYRVYTNMQNVWNLDREIDESEWKAALLEAYPPDEDRDNPLEATIEAMGIEAAWDYEGPNDSLREFWRLKDGTELYNNPLDDLAYTTKRAWRAESGRGHVMEPALDNSPTGQASVLWEKAAEIIIARNNFDGYSFSDREMGGTTYVATRPSQIRIASRRSPPSQSSQAANRPPAIREEGGEYRSSPVGTTLDPDTRADLVELTKSFISDGAESAEDVADGMRALMGRDFDEYAPHIEAIFDEAQGKKSEVRSQESEEKPHHSTYQPKNELGQFDGPPSSDYTPKAERGPEITGVASSVIESERAARGLAAIEKQARKSFGKSFERGRDIVESSPDFRENVARWAKVGRSLTDEESAALAYDRMRLYNEHRQAMERIESTHADGHLIEEAAAREALERIEQEIDDNDRAAMHGGTLAGRNLAIRRLILKEDYSLAHLLQRARVATGGEVSTDLRERLTELSRQLEEAQKNLDERDSKIADLESERAMRRLKQETQREERKQKRKKTSEQLKTEFDDLSRQFLKAASSLAANPLFKPDLYKLIGQMARNRVAAGVNTIEGLVDDIHSTIKDSVEGVSKRDVRDAISGYGAPRLRTKTAIENEMARLKREMRKQSRAEDEASGVKEKRKPRPLTDEQKQKATRTRLQTRLDELQRMLDTGEYYKNEQGEPTITRPRHPLESDPQAEKLRREVARVKAAIEMEFRKMKRQHLADVITHTRQSAMLANIIGIAQDVISTTGHNIVATIQMLPEAILDAAQSARTGQRVDTVRGTKVFTSIGRGLKRTGPEARLVMKTGVSDRMAAEQEIPRETYTGEGRAARIFDMARNYVSRIRTVADLPNWEVALEIEHRNASRSMAETEAKQGLIDKSEIEARAEEIYANISLADQAEIALSAAERIAKEEATAEARYRTFKHDNPFSRWLSKINQPDISPGVRFVVRLIIPFEKAMSNYVKASFDLSGAGIATGLTRALLNIARGQRVGLTGKGRTETATTEQIRERQKKANRAFGRGVTGGAGGLLLGYTLAALGVIGDPEDDENKKKGRIASLHIFGQSFDIGWLGPVALPLAIGAGFYHNQWKGAGRATARGLVQFPGIRGAKELYNYAQIAESKDMGEKLATTGGRLVSSFIPGFVKDIARLTDMDASRDARGFLPQLKQNIPGLRQSLPERNIRFEGAAKDEIRRLGMEVEAERRRDETKERVAESDEMRANRHKALSEKLQSKMPEWIASSEYKNLDDKQKKEWLKEQVTRVKAEVTGRFALPFRKEFIDSSPRMKQVAESVGFNQKPRGGSLEEFQSRALEEAHRVAQEDKNKGRAPKSGDAAIILHNARVTLERDRAVEQAKTREWFSELDAGQQKDFETYLKQRYSQPRVSIDTRDRAALRDAQRELEAMRARGERQIDMTYRNWLISKRKKAS